MNHTPVIRADQLADIPTDELTHLADRFHVLTLSMYRELCSRRTAEIGTAQIETLLREEHGDTS